MTRLAFSVNAAEDKPCALQYLYFASLQLMQDSAEWCSFDQCRLLEGANEEETLAQWFLYSGEVLI